MQQYEIAIRNEKIKGYHLLALWIVVLHFSVFIYLLSYDVFRAKAITAVILTILYMAIIYFYSRKRNQSFYIDRSAFFILAGCWIILQNYILFCIMIFLGFLYILSLQKIKFHFSEDVIIRQTIPRKIYAWQQFVNVMVKDDLLTLDMINNTILQLELEPGQQIDEKDFNQFAQHQIRTHKAAIV
ncbi:hypothetical protein BH20BAC1_BH20BAC1_26490 [soil metagenome]